MPTNKNRVQMTVSGTPGTGTITVSAASSGYQAFAAGDDGKKFDCVFVDGTAWEVARECTYTHSGTTISRGTLEESSTGSAISLTSAAIVKVSPSAARGQTWDSAALATQVAGTDAATSMEVNTLYTVDMSAWATADRTYTLPATAAVGDRVAIKVTSGNNTYELLVTAASGDTLDGVAGGTEWSRLFITNEMVIFRCITANATWIVEHDGRIPCSFYARITTSGDGEGAATLTLPTAISAAWTADSNVGNCFSTSSSRATMRRAGRWMFGGLYQSKDALSDGQYCSLNITDGTNSIVFAEAVLGNARAGYVSGGNSGYPAVVGSYAEYQFRTQPGALGIGTGGRFGGSEII